MWGWSPLAAGFGLAPAATIGAILSPFAGRARRPRRAPRAGRRRLHLRRRPGRCGGPLVGDEHPHYATAILPGMLLAGLGITGGFATLTGALMSRVPPRYYSMAGAARSTLFQLASAIGIAVAVALQDAGAAATRWRRTAKVWLVATVCAPASPAVVMLVAFPRRGAAPAA